jgi:hypothetical protein
VAWKVPAKHRLRPAGFAKQIIAGLFGLTSNAIQIDAYQLSLTFHYLSSNHDGVDIARVHAQNDRTKSVV